MTYCVAVKTKTGIAMVADSVVTSKQDISINKSSFGELHINRNESGDSAQESALKIFDFKQSALTFTGDGKLGFDVARLMESQIDLGVTPSKAFEIALTSTGPHNGRRTKFIHAVAQTNHAALYTYDTERDRNPVETEGPIYFGSPDEDYKNLTDFLVKQFLTRLDGQNFLVSLISALQSFGVHNYTIQEAFGGVYAGIWIDSNGTCWQPDILYCFPNLKSSTPNFSNTVLSAFRNGFLVSRGTLGKDTSIFLASSGNFKKSTQERIDNAHRAMKETGETLLTGRFQFISFLPLNYWGIAVLEMRRQLRHYLLLIEPVSSKENIGLHGMRVSPELVSVLQGFPGDPEMMGFHFCQYIPLNT